MATHYDHTYGAPVTPAEHLRLAAKLLRERAGASDPGPWTVVPPEKPGNLHLIQGDGWAVARAAAYEAPYIALMHPGVGRALADWLDVKAGANPEGVAYRDHDYECALALAREVLGTGDTEVREG